jgi:hypothetical protein
MKKLIYLLGLVIVFQSCEDPDNTVNFVLDNYESGAVLRTISSSGEFNYYEQGSSVFSATIEAHDVEDGSLMQSVEIFLSVDGGSEVLYRTLQPGEFATGPTGLPRATFQVGLTEVDNLVGFSGGSTVKIRLQLNLTNGKSYSDDTVTGSMTGSYFKSTYAYRKIVLCNVTDGSAVPGIYTIKMQDSYGDGWQDSRVKLTLDGEVYFFAMPSPYTSGIEINATLESYTGDDNSGNSTITIPESASTMKWEWIVGRYPEETSYTISYSKLDGSGVQDSYNEANGPGGEKILSICQ